MTVQYIKRYRDKKQQKKIYKRRLQKKSLFAVVLCLLILCGCQAGNTGEQDGAAGAASPDAVDTEAMQEDTEGNAALYMPLWIWKIKFQSLSEC